MKFCHLFGNGASNVPEIRSDSVALVVRSCDLIGQIDALLSLAQKRDGRESQCEQNRDQLGSHEAVLVTG